MKAVEAGTDYDLHNPRDRAVAGQRNAREVFTKMVDNAWKNGDPGIVFIGRVNATHPCPHISPVESTNPCGEQPLMPYESCNLGSLNLSKFVLPGAWGEKNRIGTLSGLPMDAYRNMPFRGLVLDTFDRLSAPVEYRYIWRDLQKWFDDTGLVVDAARD